MNKEEVLKLAKLARIDIGDAEAGGLTREFEEILGYVEQVKEVGKSGSSEVDKEKSEVRNIMREDAEPHEAGIYTERILEQAPGREGEYIKVKKIL